MLWRQRRVFLSLICKCSVCSKICTKLQSFSVELEMVHMSQHDDESTWTCSVKHCTDCWWTNTPLMMITWLVQLYSNPQQPVEITGSSPGHLSSCVEVQGAHWFQHFYAAHVLKKRNKKWKKDLLKCVVLGLISPCSHPKKGQKQNGHIKGLSQLDEIKFGAKTQK